MNKYMEIFYGVVIFVAIVGLIVLLTAAGLIMNSAKYAGVFPPRQSKCPDYWTVDSEGKCNTTLTGVNAPKTSTGSTLTTPTDETDATAQLSSVGLTSNIASINGNTLKVNFSSTDIDKIYGLSHECNLARWCTAYKVEWDGVTNDPKC